MKPTVAFGAPWVLTQKEVEAKLEQTNTAYSSFDADLRATFVFVDPTAPSQAITDAIASTDANTDEKINLQSWYIANIGGHAAVSVDHMKGKADARIASELAFYKSWLKALVRWRLFYLRNTSLTLTLYYADIWDTCDRYNAELSQWQAKAVADFGVKTTAPSPPIEPGGLGKPDLGLAIPWGFIAGAAVAIVAITRGPQIFDLVSSRFKK